MEQVARAVAGAPRLLVRALLVCFFAAIWLLLSDAAAEADGLDAPGLDVAGSAAADPVSEVVRQAGTTGRGAADQAVGAGEDVAGRVADKVDGTTDQVRSTVRETTRQVSEVVETVDPVLTPRPAPTRPAPAPEPPARNGGDTDAPERSSSTDDTREPLVTQEDPALLFVPASSVLDLVGAASAVAESAPADVLPSPGPAQLPSPGAVGGEAVPASGGSGQPAPTPGQAAHFGGAVTVPDLVLLTDAFRRAQVAPADRATSPGTTPD